MFGTPVTPSSACTYPGAACQLDDPVVEPRRDRSPEEL